MWKIEEERQLVAHALLFLMKRYVKQNKQEQQAHDLCKHMGILLSTAHAADWLCWCIARVRWIP